MDDDKQLNYTYHNGSEPSKDSVQVLIANLAHTLAQTLYCLINSSNPCDNPKVPETDTDSLLVSLCSPKLTCCIGLIVVCPVLTMHDIFS
jgi:hypothetical protein